MINKYNDVQSWCFEIKRLLDNEALGIRLEIWLMFKRLFLIKFIISYFQSSTLYIILDGLMLFIAFILFNDSSEHILLTTRSIILNTFYQYWFKFGVF